MDKRRLRKLRKVRIPRAEEFVRNRSSLTIPPWWESKNGEERNWLDLPLDITLHILKKVGIVDIVRNAQMVCSSWRDLSKQPCLFTRIIFPNPSQYFTSLQSFINFVKRIMDKSGGQIVGFCSMKYFTPKILEVVSLRGQSLKYLKVDGMSFVTLYSMAKCFPLLEHLDLRNVWPYQVLDTIREIGRSCHNLKKLRLDSEWDYRYNIIEKPSFRLHLDDVAFAIAKYMPRLQSLHLFNHTLGNKGLQAILQGCPQLEYICLRKCPFINIHDRDWLSDCSILKHKIIDARVYDEAKGYFECHLWTED